MRTLALITLVALAELVPACAGDLRREPNTAGDSAEPAHHDDDHEAHETDDAVLASEPQPAGGGASRVLVLQSSHLDRPTEVVGVVDAHEVMGHHDAALEVLKRRAAVLGADAVIGVEFHHGESEGEPTHLSGLAVRFLPKLPFASP